MKGFKKLALVTAVAALPMSGFAMEALDDATMSGVTGQDGIVMNINVPNMSLGLVVHDTDGFAAATSAGAIVIENMTVATGAGGIGAVIDAGDNAGVPILNIAVTIPSGTIINTGDISVAGSAGIGNAVTSQTGTILDSMAITLGQVNMNIQLGNEQQVVAGVGGGSVSQMIALNTAITGGIQIGDATNFADNFALRDANSGGAISVGQVNVSGAGGTDLGVVAGVNVTASGLAIGIGTLGVAGTGAGTGMDVELRRVALGTVPADATGSFIGDIEILGLNMNGTTITISGN